MKQEFGNNVTGDYWRGLEALVALTLNGVFNLQVDIVTASNGSTGPQSYKITYGIFNIGDEGTGYNLTIGEANPNFSFDAFQTVVGAKFSTYDHNSLGGGANCAQQLGGPWWYKTCQCNACLTQNPTFSWELGFSAHNLINDTMTLVCPSK